MPNTLKLYVDSQFASPYAMSAFIALREKNVPFERITVDLNARENFSTSYAALSLTRRIPTLMHDGFSLSESSAITEYVDEVFSGAALYPKGAQQKARARQIQAWLRSDLMPIRQERPTEILFYAPIKTPLSQSAQEACKKLFDIASELLRFSSENIFDEWCIADVDLSLMLNRLVLNGDPVPENLAKYADHQWARASVQEWVNQKRPSLQA